MSNKMKKGEKVNGKVLIVGIDIGKNSNTGYWRYPNGPESKVFSFCNNKSGYESLMLRIYAAGKIKNAEEVIVGFESTGSYCIPLAHYLQNQPIKLVQVNPMHTKRWKDVADNSRTKSDKKDPKIIADLIEMKRYLSVIIPRGASAHLRHLMHARERLLTKKNMSMSQLHDLVFILFPEFLKVMNGLKSKSAFYLLGHYPLPDNLIELGFEELYLLLKKISRGKLDHTRALELIEVAKESIGIKEGIESIINEIKQFLREIRLYNETIQEIEEKISLFLKKIPYRDYLLSIKGIGELSVAGLIGEVGDFEAIRTQDALIKLAGLNLCENSSGKRKGRICISKMGRALLRKILFFMAINVVKEGRILHDYYQKLIKKGKFKMKALVAVMRKLLKIIFALVRNKTYYQENTKIKLAA